ncbi:hypothetical protein DL98DRAFT_357202, partial [Cadophora sp. DSE1049]
CGENPAIARSRNCSFDLISFAWQTPECFDGPLVSEFSAYQPWSFYTDVFGRGNETVSKDIAEAGDSNLWVTWNFHVVHCTFMWRQMHRAYEKGWIDAHLRAYNHTLHCQGVLLDHETGWKDVVTAARVIYPLC